ncbi:DUF2971 domain-containing protein [Aeromonas caviae]|uniref:DUF2971 domain-containing protein n=1 Tax=Aeromonas caviae TaxID=648 RepID=UPI002B470EDA|nr:DUF2971 domain-containing protein [Aeromonas caviae]
MDSLFKYTGLLPLSYFDEPNIKLSVLTHLNDPFENITSENIFTSIRHSLQGKTSTDDLLERGIEGCRNGIDTILKLHGIVSFSETPRNSLMWAHYANQHQGICIGYKTDLFSSIPNSDINDPFSITIKEPQKINYDNLRFEEDHSFDIAYPQISKQAVIKHLMRKSDEWIYEKEHRCILPYSSASKLLISNDKATIDVVTLPEVTQMKEYLGKPFNIIVKKLVKSKNLTKTEKKNIYNIKHTDSLDIISVALQTSKDAFFLVDIDPSSIHSIYFGCKVDINTIQKYYNALKDKYKIYKFEVSRKRFELISRLVTEETFSNKDKSV